MPYIKTESDKVIAWVDDDYKDFDSLEEYINDCDFIEDLYQDGIAPENWDEIDIKNHLTDLDWSKEEYDKLVNEFNKRQKVECWQSNGIYIYPEYFNHELYGNDYLDESFKENEHEICNVIKEQKEKIKESVKNYFKEHPDLEVPTNEESGLPFWEDDFMMTHSEN